MKGMLNFLEALAERENAHAGQESAAHEADLRGAREQTARRLDSIAGTCRQLQSLAAQDTP